MRFHNGCLLMPIFFGAAFTVSGIELSAMPHRLMNFAQLMFGLVLGARYERAFFGRYRMFIPFALLNSFFILIASGIAAAVLAWTFSLPIATMIIATSPGGLAEMTITAACTGNQCSVNGCHLFRVRWLTWQPSIFTHGPHGFSIEIIRTNQVVPQMSTSETIIG